MYYKNNRFMPAFIDTIILAVTCKTPAHLTYIQYVCTHIRTYTTNDTVNCLFKLILCHLYD